jgi:hypothetical protein
LRSDFEPGQYVRNPRAPDWGLGQVQTALGAKVTVMFENAGKIVVDTDRVALDHADLASGPD